MMDLNGYDTEEEETRINPLKLDEVDLDILTLMGQLDKSEKVTTSEIAKKIFNIEGTNDLRKKTNFVRSRLNNKLVDRNLVDIEKEGKKNVYVLSDKVSTISKGELDYNSEDRSEKLPLNNIVLIRFKKAIRICALSFTEQS